MLKPSIYILQKVCVSLCGEGLYPLPLRRHFLIFRLAVRATESVAEIANRSRAVGNHVDAIVFDALKDKKLEDQFGIVIHAVKIEFRRGIDFVKLFDIFGHQHIMFVEVPRDHFLIRRVW